MTLKIKDSDKCTFTMNDVVDIVKFTSTDGNKYTRFMLKSGAFSTYESAKIKKIGIVITEIKTVE